MIKLGAILTILLASVKGSVAQEILPVQDGPEYELLRRRSEEHTSEL